MYALCFSGVQALSEGGPSFLLNVKRGGEKWQAGAVSTQDKSFLKCAESPKQRNL